MPIEIRKPLKKLLPHLLKAREENLNEADTVQRVLKVFEDVLGYDVMTEITREQQVKDKFVDIAIKLDDSVKFLVEVKAANVVLRDRHIEQAERYGAQANIRWVLLTNGIQWNVYHLSFEEGVESERVFALDFATGPLAQAAELLSILHRQSIQNAEHEDFWEERKALSPESIARALFSEDILRLLRRSIRKKQGLLIDIDDLATAMHLMLSTEARERIGPMRIYKAPRPQRPKQQAKEETPQPAGETPTPS